jgi:hypothetical protein
MILAGEIANLVLYIFPFLVHRRSTRDEVASLILLMRDTAVLAAIHAHTPASARTLSHLVNFYSG